MRESRSPWCPPFLFGFANEWHRPAFTWPTDASSASCVNNHSQLRKVVLIGGLLRGCHGRGEGRQTSSDQSRIAFASRHNCGLSEDQNYSGGAYASVWFDRSGRGVKKSPRYNSYFLYTDGDRLFSVFPDGRDVCSDGSIQLCRFVLNGQRDANTLHKVQWIFQELLMHFARDYSKTSRLQLFQ